MIITIKHTDGTTVTIDTLGVIQTVLPDDPPKCGNQIEASIKTLHRSLSKVPTAPPATGWRSQTVQSSATSAPAPSGSISADDLRTKAVARLQELCAAYMGRSLTQTELFSINRATSLLTGAANAHRLIHRNACIRWSAKDWRNEKVINLVSSHIPGTRPATTCRLMGDDDKYSSGTISLVIARKLIDLVFLDSLETPADKRAYMILRFGVAMHTYGPPASMINAVGNALWEFVYGDVDVAHKIIRDFDFTPYGVSR